MGAARLSVLDEDDHHVLRLRAGNQPANQAWVTGRPSSIVSAEPDLAGGADVLQPRRLSGPAAPGNHRRQQRLCSSAAVSRLITLRGAAARGRKSTSPSLVLTLDTSRTGCSTPPLAMAV